VKIGEPVTCYISLGGNVGDARRCLTRALDRLNRSSDVAVDQVSSFYVTEPVGRHAGGEFVNAVAVLSVRLEPLELLELLQRVERELGRQRSVRWGPRTVDLDLLFYGERLVRSDRLQVPHPRCWYRRFVLEPLVEIAPHARHPERQATAAQLLTSLNRRPLAWAFLNRDLPDAARKLEREFGAVRAVTVRSLEQLPAEVAFVTLWPSDNGQEDHVPPDAPWSPPHHDPVAATQPADTSLPHPRWLSTPEGVGAAEQFWREVFQSALGRCERQPS